MLSKQKIKAQSMLYIHVSISAHVFVCVWERDAQLFLLSPNFALQAKADSCSGSRQLCDKLHSIGVQQHKAQPHIYTRSPAIVLYQKASKPAWNQANCCNTCTMAASTSYYVTENDITPAIT